jgi:hypothetical protein
MPLETTKFDVLDHHATIEEQIAYLEAALDQSDPSFIATAIGVLPFCEENRYLESGRGSGSMRSGNARATRRHSSSGSGYCSGASPAALRSLGYLPPRSLRF